MANLNKVMLIGNLTRDVELRYTPGGTAVCSFGLATNRKWKNKQGEQQEEVTFVDVEAWARTAELCQQYLSKGSPLFVEGRLKLDQWQSKDGQRRSKLKVVIENMQFLCRGGKAEAPRRRQEERPPANDDTFDISDDDIPF